MSKLTVKETIEKYTNENGFAWGINTAVDAIKPDLQYDLSASNGEFIINSWSLKQPTSKEIKEEYIRQKTIAECLDFIKNNKIWVIKFLFKK
jgi:hypothetical protein